MYIICNLRNEVCNLARTKKWILAELDNRKAKSISDACHVGKLAARVLAARGFDGDSAKEFLSVSPSCFHDPFLLNDMQKAVDTVKSALERNKKIAVYGDYDTDGITSSYIMYDFLKSLGADITYYIPDREGEGYGVSTVGIDRLSAQGVSLIITVDTGITAVEETEYAKKLGITLVITDHHTPKDTLPDAAAVVNPKVSPNYPFDALAGVGVAFKLAYALSDCDRDVFERYCGIAAVGTVADMVPLTGENRYIAAVGIDRLHRSLSIGLNALAQVAGKDMSTVNATDIGFAFSPRLNAAGRMASAKTSVELLLTDDENDARQKALFLDECNRHRQDEEQRILKEALEIIEKNHYENDNYILVAKENWLHGVIGIVSSRITEIFCKPSSVVSIDTDGNGKASGRSIRGVNIFDALTNCKDDLVKFGGHELAAGFSVRADRIDDLRCDMNRFIAPLMTEEICTPTLKIDCEISLGDINLATAGELEVLEPHGIENAKPLFCINNVTLESVRFTSNGKHAFLTLSADGETREVPAFSMAEQVRSLERGDAISLAGSLGINCYKGKRFAQFIVRDIHSDCQLKQIGRSELALIFTALRSDMQNGGCSVDKISFAPIFGHSGLLAFKKPKRKAAFKIFEELDIIKITDCGSTLMITEGKNFKAKTELKNSETYMKFGREVCI